jgi:hypothetical protein
MSWREAPIAPAATGREAWREAPVAPEQPLTRNQWLDLVWDTGAGAVDAATFGFADELVGLAGGDGARDWVRGQFKSAQRDNPGFFFGGGLATAAIPGFGLLANAGRLTNAGRRATQGASLVEKARFGAGVGAGAGALYGAGSGDTMEERLAFAGSGALAGAALGAALPPVAAAMGRVFKGVTPATRQAAQFVGDTVPGFGRLPGFRPTQTAPANPRLKALEGVPLLNRLPGVQPTTSRAEALLFERAVEDLAPDGGNVADALEAVYRSNRAVGGSKPTLLDLTGENVSRVTEYAASLPGPGRNMMRSAVDERISDQAARVEAIINKKTGAPAKGGDSLRTTLAALDEEQRRLAAPLYAKVRDVMVRPDLPVKVRKPLGRGGQDDFETLRLADILARPSVQRATLRAAQLAAEFGEDLAAQGLRPGGVITRADGRVRLDLLNWIKMGLDAEIQISRNPAANIDRAELAAMKRTAAQLVDVLDGLVAAEGRPGEYARARTMYSGVARMKDAAELGRRVFAPGEGGHSGFLDDAAELLYPTATSGAPVMQKAEIRAALAGLRDSLMERALSAGDGRDLYKAVLGNKAIRQRIAAVFGPLTKTGLPNPAARGFFRQVFAEAERLRRIRETYSRTGSQTAPRQFEAEAVDQELSAAFINTLFDAAGGNPMQAMMGAGRNLLMGGITQKQPLTSKEAAQVVQTALAPLSAAKGQPLAMAQHWRAMQAALDAQKAKDFLGRWGRAGTIAWGAQGVHAPQPAS